MIKISAKSTDLNTRKPVVARSSATLYRPKTAKPLSPILNLAIQEQTVSPLVLLPFVTVKPPKALDPQSPLIRGILGPKGREHLKAESIGTRGEGENTVWLVPNDNPYSKEFSLLAMALEDSYGGQIPMSPDQNSPEALTAMFLAYSKAVELFPGMKLIMGFNDSSRLTGQLLQRGTDHNFEGKAIPNQSILLTHAQIFAEPEQGDSISYKESTNPVIKAVVRIFTKLKEQIFGKPKMKGDSISYKESTNPHEIALIHGSKEEKEWAKSVAVYLKECFKENASLNGINSGKKLFEVLEELPKFEIITSEKGLKIIFQQNQEELLTNPKFTEFFQSVLALIHGYNEKEAIEENEANYSLAPNFLNIHKLLNAPENMGDILSTLNNPSQDFIPVKCMAVFIQEGEKKGTTEIHVREKRPKIPGGAYELATGYLLNRGKGVMPEEQKQVWENNIERYANA